MLCRLVRGFFPGRTAQVGQRDSKSLHLLPLPPRVNQAAPVLSSSPRPRKQQTIKRTPNKQVEGELKVARKYPGCAEQAQREIYRWMREALSAGKHVVRLKIGDPFIFGRGGEEVLEMRRLGVEPKVVPGISSVFSAPLLGGVPVTHRGVATQVGVPCHARGGGRGVEAGGCGGVQFVGGVLRRPACFCLVCWKAGRVAGALLLFLCFRGRGPQQRLTRRDLHPLVSASCSQPTGRKALDESMPMRQTPVRRISRRATLHVQQAAVFRTSTIRETAPALCHPILSVLCVIQSFRFSSEQPFHFSVSSNPFVSRPNNTEQVTLGTGYGQDYARPDICDYHPQKTAVFLMAIGRLEELCEDLVRRSYPRDTPVIIVENASTPRQR